MLMQQAQKMQKEMEKAQKELEAKTFEIVSAGGGIVVRISGKKEVLSVDIDEEMIDPSEKEMLQDMIVVAVNEAIAKVVQDLSITSPSAAWIMISSFTGLDT